MLYIHLFGHLRLFDSEQTFQFSALPKTLPLLTYLLLQRENGPISREKLAFTLWPDEAEEKAKANLRRHLYDLQQALPKTADDDATWLIRSRSTVQWNQDADYWLDVAEFEKLSRSADHLAKAVTLYAGDLLPSEYDDWLDAYRERFRHQYLDNLEQLMSRSREQKDFRQAVAYAKQLLAYDPLQEDVMREFLLLRYELGDRAGAIQAYLEFVELLENELEVTPLSETVLVYEAIRDDKVEQLFGIGLPEGVNANSGDLERQVNNLPAQLTSFFGRTLDIITVHDLFFTQKPTTRLLTLTGPGGSGKTRLALELAARVLPIQAELFPDGIFFVDLSAVIQPEKVLETIIDILEVKGTGTESQFESLIKFISEKYLLLILDNFEQVLDAGSLVGELLAAAPGLRVMITSRAALQLYGEQEYPVAPLPLPELDQKPSIEGLLEFAAVSLFVARSRAYKSDFTLTEENAVDVVQICTLLDGLPLALELAAARIKLFWPKAMVAQLHSKLAFLSSKVRNLPARQQTLRDTLDWSYHLLDDDEKKLFRRLALFRGGFSVEAVARVALVKDGKRSHEAVAYLALDLLVALSEQSMIQFSQSEVDSQPRFIMLSTVREYAMEMLQQEKQPVALNNRYALYFAGLAEIAIEGLRGPEQAKWVKQIREEENNMQAALDWLLDKGGEERAQFLLAQVIGESHVRKGHFADAATYYKLGIEKAELIDDLQLQTKGWIGLADLCIERGDNKQALAAAQKAEALVQQILAKGGNSAEYELVTAVTFQGWALSRLGDFEAALPIAERAVALSQTAGGPMAKLVAMNLLAYLYDDVGRYNDGSIYHQGALAIAREVGDRPWESVLLNNLAESYKMMGNFEGAIKVFDDAFQLSQLMGYRHVENLVLVNTGDAQLELNQFVEAEVSFRQALNEIEDKPTFFLSFCYALLGRACAAQGKIEEGELYAQKALKLAVDMENPEDKASAWHALAEVAMVRSERVVIVGRRPYTPSECFEISAKFYQENGQESERARLLVKWAEYEASEGDRVTADLLFQEAEEVFTRYDLPLFLARIGALKG